MGMRPTSVHLTSSFFVAIKYLRHFIEWSLKKGIATRGEIALSMHKCAA
jgi:hypothetical protein